MFCFLGLPALYSTPFTRYVKWFLNLFHNLPRCLRCDVLFPIVMSLKYKHVAHYVGYGQIALIAPEVFPISVSAHSPPRTARASAFIRSIVLALSPRMSPRTNDGFLTKPASVVIPRSFNPSRLVGLMPSMTCN